MWVFHCTLKKMEIKNIFQIQSVKHSIENWKVKKNKFEKDIENLNFVENQFATSRNVKQKINLNEIFKRNFKKELNLLEKTINNKLILKNVWVVKIH